MAKKKANAKQAKKRDPLDLVPVHREDLKVWYSALVCAAQLLQDIRVFASDYGEEGVRYGKVAEQIAVLLK